MDIFKYKTIIRCVLCTIFICSIGSKAFADDENAIWHESKEEAFAIAKEQNKYVLLILGHNKCDNCNIMKAALINRPELKEIVDKSYILWYCDTNKSDEGNVYDQMYPSAFIPLVCIIDPNDPMSPLHHSNGFISARNLKTLLEDKQPTANKNISDATTQAYVSNNMLTVSNTFSDEVISIYSLNGQLVDLFPKKEYSITRVISSLPKGLLLISSSEKWARKILNKQT